MERRGRTRRGKEGKKGSKGGDARSGRRRGGVKRERGRGRGELCDRVSPEVVADDHHHHYHHLELDLDLDLVVLLLEFVLAFGVWKKWRGGIWTWLGKRVRVGGY